MEEGWAGRSCQGTRKEVPRSEIKVLSELRAGVRVVPMFKEVKAREGALTVCVQRVCAP